MKDKSMIESAIIIAIELAVAAVAVIILYNIMGK